MATLAVGVSVKCSTRWWNAGRYEAERAAFDVEHPLSREVWESLQRSRWSWLAYFVIVPRDSLLSREPQPDPWEQFARDAMRRYWECVERSPMVFDV